MPISFLTSWVSASEYTPDLEKTTASAQFYVLVNTFCQFAADKNKAKFGPWTILGLGCEYKFGILSWKMFDHR